MFFDSWAELIRVVVVGVLAYAALVAALRISGNRTLSKLNAFDLVITVALGSTLATVVLSESVSLAESLVAFGVLIGLQFSVTWLAVRSGTFQQLIAAEPVLLFYRGEFLSGRLRKQRVLESEVRTAVREAGIASLSNVEAVVLEPDGSLSVVQGSDAVPSTLQPLIPPQDSDR